MITKEIPLVSVVVPIYNMEEFLAETLDSVLKSTYSPFEMILVDDGSKDKSIEIAHKYISEFPTKIKLFCQSNGGAAKARNFGIDKASGKYILPVDADNLIDSDYIKQAVDVLENNSNVKIVYSDAVFFGEKQGPWQLPPFSLKLLARKNMIDNCAMFSKSDWEKVGGYCEEILGPEDWDFWMSILKYGGDVVKLPLIGLYYRIRPNSKRRTTRHLKRSLLAQLNQRHKVFIYKNLGGKLRNIREWSEVINKINHIFNPEIIIVNPDFNEFEDFIYNIPEVFDNDNNIVLSSNIKAKLFVEKDQNILVESFGMKPFFERITSENSAKFKYKTILDEYKSGKTTRIPIGYYEQKKLFCSGKGYFAYIQND